MRVAQLDFADRSFPVSLVDKDEPELPNDEWVRVAVTAGGICGSDLHLFKPTTGSTPILTNYVGFPMEMGHEIAGRVIEAGSSAGVEPGTLVAIDPTIACEARGIEPLCKHCADGRPSACANIGSQKLTAGMGLGFTNGLGGGWADQVLAHRSMVHRLPDGVDATTASLHENLSIAVNGYYRRPANDGDPICVIGAGIIGLGAVAAARHLYPRSEVTAVARYAHQADAAARLGAHNVVTADDQAINRLADITGTDVVGGSMLRTGFPYVVEAVGAPDTVTQALRLAEGRGTVLLLGAAGISDVDLTPVFFKEVELVGSFCHSSDSIETSLSIMANGGFPADVCVTHRFPLDQLRDAVRAGLEREAGAIKVVLGPDDPEA